MKNTIIGVKQLQTDLKKIIKESQNGHSFLVMRHHTPLFYIEPLKRKSTQDIPNEKSQKISVQLEKLQFSGGDKNMSSNIDTTLYE